MEVKATRSLGEKHFSGPRDMQAALGKRFACGAALYGGEQAVQFGKSLWAMPVSALWASASAPS